MGGCTSKQISNVDKIKVYGPELKFIPDSNRVDNIWKYFKKTKKLGKGATSSVYKAVRKSDGEVMALKQMPLLDDCSTILFEQEYNILTSITHPNILKMENVYVDKKNLYISTQLCHGGALLERIKSKEYLSEKMAKNIIRQLLETIDFCHNRNIVHRDLKPENIMFKDNSDDSEIVIIDWGESTVVQPYSTYHDLVGTTFYLAPEMMRPRKGWELKKCDMWAIGIIAYAMLTCSYPFYDINQYKIIEKIMFNPVSWPKEINVSIEAKNFIMALLNKNSSIRFNAKQALKHPWLNDNITSPKESVKDEFHSKKNFQNILKWKIIHEMKNDEYLGENVGKYMLKRLSNYDHACGLKKLIINGIIKDMSLREKYLMRKSFGAIDVNRKGRIGTEEIIYFLESKCGFSSNEACSYAQQLILDFGEEINFKKFIRSYICQQLNTQKDILDKSFQRMADDNGMITEHDIRILLENNFCFKVTQRILFNIVSEIDQNKNGHISYGEFINAMT